MGPLPPSFFFMVIQKGTHLDCREELAEPLVLLADLEGQLSGVAHHKNRDLKAEY